MKLSQFYTYLHCKPNGSPFYVGKGIYSRCYQFTKRNQYHERIVKKYGKENIQIIIFKKDSEESAFKSEIRLIRILRRAGFELANLTNGGEGIVGLVRSKEHCEKLSIAGRGKKRAPFSDKARENMSIAAKKYRTDEYKAKISLANTGKKRSKETCEKISKNKKSTKGIPWTTARREAQNRRSNNV